MAAKHALAKFLLSCLPTDIGMHRLRRYLPSVPDTVDALYSTTLRGYPLKLMFNPKTYFGWELYYRGMYEDRITGKCARLLKKGMVFVDVGAHYGIYTIIASHKVGANGTVLSFEPQSKLARVIQDNVKLNALNNVIVRSCALSDRKATMNLYQPSRTNDGQATLHVLDNEKTFGEPEQVNVECLTDIVKEHGLDRIDIMKIDVEGAELAVLRGANAFLAKQQPEVIFLECIDEYLVRFGHSSLELFTFLWKHGYRTAGLLRTRWIPFARLDEYKHRTHSTTDILAVHPATRSYGRVKGIFE